MKKVIFSSIAAIFAAICPAATTYNLANGNVTVPVNTEAIITQSNSGTTTKNTISIGDGATVTLSGVNIANTASGFGIKCLGNATLILADGTINKVAASSRSSKGDYRDYPAILQGPKGKTLTIKGGSAGDGYLYAKGYGPGIGTTSSYSDLKSGITNGNIVVRSGIIEAIGGSGAGIGSGAGSVCGDITISGGVVTANGGSGTAGIGSGDALSSADSRCGNITISGGTVTAKGGYGYYGCGAGIGCGVNSSEKGGICGNILISGGSVTATSGGREACGIGLAGKTYIGYEGTCGTIRITEGITKVVATGKYPICNKYNSNTIYISNVLIDETSGETRTLTVPTYTITWKNENGTTLKTTLDVKYGTVPVYNGATPTKASTAQYSYTFKGWSPTVAAATADKTYTATYNATVRSYKVTWKDDDGTTLRVDSVQYGTSPGYGEEPTRDGYTFDGWFTAAEGGDLLSEGTIVTKDMSFFAHWKRSSFLAGEDVACTGVNVTLASAQAEWLNGFGDYETVKAAVAAMEADKFEEAYLLNLDLTNAERGYAFEVVGIDARGAEVVVTARLVRSGAVQSSGGKNAPINGVLRLYGSKTPEKNGFAPMADAVVSDATFASGETATLTLSKSGENHFFYAVIAAP